MSEEEEGLRARKRWQFQVSVHCAAAGVRMGHIAGGVGAGSPLSSSVIRLPLLIGPEGGTWSFSPGVTSINFPVGPLHRQELPCLPLWPWWSFLSHRIVSGLKGWFGLCVSAALLAGPNYFLLSLDVHPRTQDSRSVILDTRSPNWPWALISFFWVSTLQKGHNKPFHEAPSAVNWCTSGHGYKHSLGT